MDVEWLENTIPLQRMIDNNLAVNFFSPAAIPSDNANGNNYDSSKVEGENDQSSRVSMTQAQGGLFCCKRSHLVVCHRFAFQTKIYKRITVVDDETLNRFALSIDTHDQ